LKSGGNRNMIKVAIVDDDLVWNKQVTQFINNQDDMHISWSATSKEEAIAFAKSGVANVILMDINLDSGMQNYEGIIIANEILKNQPVKIIMMTNLTDIEYIKKSITAGAVNFLYKKNFEKLPETIRDTCSQNTVLGIISQDYIRLKEREQLKLLNLTDTETEVFLLLKNDNSVENVCEKLAITKGTYKKHLGNILRKLNADNLEDAIQIVQSKFI